MIQLRIEGSNSNCDIYTRPDQYSELDVSSIYTFALILLLSILMKSNQFKYKFVYSTVILFY